MEIGEQVMGMGDRSPAAGPRVVGSGGINFKERYNIMQRMFVQKTYSARWQ